LNRTVRVRGAGGRDVQFSTFRHRFQSVERQIQKNLPDPVRGYRNQREIVGSFPDNLFVSHIVRMGERRK